MTLLDDIVRRASTDTGSASATDQRDTSQPQPATDGAASQAGVNTEVLAKQASSSASPTGQSVQAFHDSKHQPAHAPRANANVDAAFSELERRKGQNLNWRGSIVDLLELLELDSSPDTRRTLAGELNYTGDTGDTAAMDAWLHTEVMRWLNSRMS